MSDSARLARVEQLLADLRREHGLCGCADRLARALGVQPCRLCGGRGKVTVRLLLSNPPIPVHETCAACGGTGVRREVPA